MHQPRGSPPRVGPHAERPLIRLDLNVALVIGSKHRESRPCGERGQRFWGGMAVLVVDADRDDRHRWPERVEGRRSRGRARPVMPDLEDIDRRERVPSEERRLDRRLGIAGEERREATVFEEDDDRPVVDVAIRERRRRLVG